MTPKNGPIVKFFFALERRRRGADFTQQNFFCGWRRLASRDRILNYFQNGGCSTGKTKGRRIMIFFSPMESCSGHHSQKFRSLSPCARAHLKSNFWLFLCLHRPHKNVLILSQEAQIWHAYTRRHLETFEVIRFLNF